MILAVAAMMVSRGTPPAHHGSRASAARAVKRAKGSLVGLFSADDYPNDALRRGEVGTVGVRLTIGTNGRTSRCVITASSHSPSLDAATCRILTERAGFAPARDRRGKPTIDHYSQRITWQIPESSPSSSSSPPPSPPMTSAERAIGEKVIQRALAAMSALNARGGTAVTRAKGSLVGLFNAEDYPSDALRRGDEGTVAVQMLIGADGRVSRCVVTTSSHSPSLDAATCRILTERAGFTPARNRHGKPTTDQYFQRITWQIPAAPPVLFANLTYAQVMTVPVSGEPACAWSITGAPAATTSKADCARLLPDWKSYLSILAIDFVAPYRMSFLTEQRLGDPLSATPNPQWTIRGGAALTIDPDGKVSDCSPIAALSLNGDDGASLCDDGRKMRFPALPATDKLRAPRSLTMIRSLRYEPLPPTASGTTPQK
jgi:TonB family protein